ncbi:MAG: transposase [Dysgonamonadaceae bacterium]|jgi:IS4 transposase|nr:transposase [Dysgonamonadaceae bacterium]
MNKEMDLYSDYLLSSFAQVTATGLSKLLDGAVSHDKITRMLSGHTYSSKYLWQEVKPLVRQYESEDASLIFDDTIVSKPCTDENDLISWHWDHSKGRNEKGINLLTAFYPTQSLSASEALRVPVAFECVKKSVRFCEIKTREEKRQSPVTKNEMMRSMLQQAVENQHLKFRYVLADSRFSSSDNLLFIARLGKYFVMDMKSNRLCMFSTQDRNRGRWTGMDKLPLQAEQPVKVWIKDLEIEVLLCKFVFTNRDGSTGDMYLLSNDLELSAEDFRTLYKKRWSVEEYHKSLKQNASLAKSPTRTVTTQTNHLFASLLAYIKLEQLKFIHRLNHFALKSKIYFSALKNAWNELDAIKNYNLA